MRLLAAAALVASLLAACTVSPPPKASVPRLASPSPAVTSPVASNSVDSKAADFRTRLDLLLGEQVAVIAKESSAAGRGAEYVSYLRLLTANGNDLTELVRSALGDTAATSFGQIWSAQNDNVVNYTIGLVTHDKTKADSAMSGLRGKFVQQLSQFLAGATQLPQDPIAQLASEHVFETKAMIDDQIAQNYPKMYGDFHAAYTQASRIGDAIAPGIAQRFPDKFPGSASSPAVDMRVTMNNLLQEHEYLATMTTSAKTGGRAAEQAAAAQGLAANADALGALFSDLFGAPVGTQFDQIWAAKDAALIGYASASTSGAKQSALSRLKGSFVTQFTGFISNSTGLPSATSLPAIEAQIEATITVIDDQRSRSSTNVGADDRFADASMGTVADLIADAVVAKLPQRFS